MSAKDQIRGTLSATPIDTAVIVELTGLSRQTVMKALKELAADGTVEYHNNGDRQWSLSPKVEPLRLPPGTLREMVLTHLAQTSEDASPHEIGKAIGRSAGAVANALDKLTLEGQIEQVSAKPRRYAARG